MVYLTFFQKIKKRQRYEDNILVCLWNAYGLSDARLIWQLKLLFKETHCTVFLGSWFPWRFWMKVAHRLINISLCWGPLGLGIAFLSMECRSLSGFGCDWEWKMESKARCINEGFESVITLGIFPFCCKMLIAIICSLPVFIGQFISKGYLPHPRSLVKFYV